MDYGKELTELREKINWSKTDSDVAKHEQHYREIRNELVLKREQVPQLRQELATANTKLFQQNRELEMTKSLLKEAEFNLKLAIKKSATLEEKFKETNEAFLSLKLKEEMRLSEVQILKDTLHEVAYEKEQLQREAQDLRDKLKFSTNFQEELEQKQVAITATAVKIKENMQKFEKEQLQMADTEKKLRIAEEFQRISESLAEENRKLRKEITNVENGLIETTAKYDTLKALITKGSSHCYQPDIIQKIKFLQWEDRCVKLTEKNKKNEEIIGALTAALNKEMETNARLLKQIENFESPTDVPSSVLITK